MVKKNLMYERAKEIQEEIVSHRRYFHQNPELSMNLPLTTKYVKERLIEMGYEPKDCGPSGVVATVGGKHPGKVFLIRGDMDALPVKEEVESEFKSQNDNMHACGHDMHTSMLLGAAKLLKEIEDDLKGTVKLMFQPGEETLKGAKSMIEAGLLENPKVDAAAMIHVMSGMPIPEGKVIIPEDGPGAAASDWFEIEIRGKGGHGAMPDATVDPLNIAAHIHIAIQAINSREISPAETAILTVGKMAGGTTSNVIPDTAELHGTIRTFSKETRNLIHKRLVEISEGIGKTFRGEVDANIILGCPALINDLGLVESAEKFLPEILGQENVIPMRLMNESSKMSGSEDFAFLSEKVPTLMLALSAGNSEDGYKYPMHHPKVKFKESVLYRGAATYAYLAKRWLEENQ